MKRCLLWLTVLSLLLSLCACDIHTSSYRAIGLVRTQTSHGFETSFYSLEGRLVFKIKKSRAGTEGDIYYSVQVDEGELHLYYDTLGTKQELAHVKAGESVATCGGYVEGKQPVYIIIEAGKNTRGKVSVELDRDASDTTP